MARNPIFVNNYIKPEPIFIENFSDLPKSVEKRLLFEVSEDVYSGFTQRMKSRQNAVRCNEEEAASMRESLEVTEGLTVDDFCFVGNIKCEKCARQLNYFDVFKTGEKIHGLDFLKWACLSPVKKIGVAPSSKQQMLICTNCEHVWKSQSAEEILDSGITEPTDQEMGYSEYLGGKIGYWKI